MFFEVVIIENYYCNKGFTEVYLEDMRKFIKIKSSLMTNYVLGLKEGSNIKIS